MTTKPVRQAARLRSIHWALLLAPVAWVLIVVLVEDAIREPESTLGAVAIGVFILGPFAALLLGYVAFRMYLAREAGLSAKERAAAQGRSFITTFDAQLQAERLAELIEARDRVEARDEAQR